MKLENKKLYNIIRNLYYKYPSLRKTILKLDRKLMFKPVFDGGLLKTESVNPWEQDKNSQIFLESIQEIKNHCKSNLDKNKIDELSIDVAKWRYWIVSFAVKHVIQFTKVEKKNFVECGVAEGFSSYIALKEIESNKTIKDFEFHLYDSWKPMKKESLVSSEYSNIGKYQHLDEHIVKDNLKKFEQFVIYHPGYIPEIFDESPEAPKSIVYLAIDLNAAKPTKDTLEKFFPILEPGGVIIFDDYGVKEYHDTKNSIDEFLENKEGSFLKLPTGQAIFFK